MVDQESSDTRLRQEARAWGADYVGVAGLTSAQALVRELGGEILAQFPRAVSVGVVMPYAIVDQLPRHAEKAVALAYRSHSYTILNARLDEIASHLASALQGAGYRAFPIAASQIIDDERCYRLFSHKLAAHLAGLGWIGKSCMVITPEHGPRVRWASILTDAPLAAGEPLADRCGDCRVCVEACPPRAFTGRNFREDEPRQARFDVSKCQAYQGLREGAGQVMACGMCVFACPYGRSQPT